MNVALIDALQLRVPKPGLQVQCGGASASIPQGSLAHEGHLVALGREGHEQVRPVHSMRAGVLRDSGHGTGSAPRGARDDLSSDSVTMQHILGMTGRGADEEVTTFNYLPLNQTGPFLVSSLGMVVHLTPSLACISCGQCTAVCPVGALTEKTHVHDVEYGLRHKTGDHKIFIAHTAPAVRVAISVR